MSEILTPNGLVVGLFEERPIKLDKAEVIAERPLSEEKAEKVAVKKSAPKTTKKK